MHTATSYRLVIDRGTPEQMWSALAPGQSEHPYHPHFDDGSDVDAAVTGSAPAPGVMRLVLEPVEAAP